MLIPYTFWPRRRTWLVLRYGLLTVLVSAFILGTLMMNSDDDARSAHHHHAPIEYEAIDLEAEEEYQQVDDGERNMYPHKIEANKKRLKRKRKISSPGDLLAKLSRRRAEIKYDREIAADEAKFDPILGSDGLGAYLPEEEQKAAQEVMKKEAFNRMVSDRVPYNRTLPGMIADSRVIQHIMAYINLIRYPGRIMQEHNLRQVPSDCQCHHHLHQRGSVFLA